MKQWTADKIVGKFTLSDHKIHNRLQLCEISVPYYEY